MTVSPTYHFTRYLFLLSLCLTVPIEISSQCATISNVGFNINQNLFCNVPAEVHFYSSAQLDSTHQLLSSNISPNNFQQAFSFTWNTANNGCYYYLTMSGSVTLWGNMNHFDGYAKFNSNTNVMYAPPGLNNYLSQPPDIGPTVYDTTHVYDFFYLGDGGPLSFSFNDFPLWDNFGSVTFDWHAIPCFHYSWDFGDGVTSTEKSPTHIYENPGIYEATLVITDSLNNCSASYTDTIKVFQGPVVSASGLLPEYCVSDSLSILTGSPEEGLFSGSGIMNNEFHPSLVGPGGPFEIIYQYTDTNGCSQSDTMTTLVHDNPQIDLIGLKNAYCANDPADLLSGVPSGGDYYGIGISGNSFYPEDSPLEVPIEIEYAYTDQNGCSSKTMDQTLVHGIPYPNLGPDTGYCFPGSLQLYPGSFSQYDWGHSENIITYATKAGLYWVTVTDQNGCQNSDSINIFNHCMFPIYIPNSFTPDGDGVNDIFKPVIDPQYIQEYSFFIVDRWGELIFKTTELAEGWDGSYGPTYVPAGTYIWMVSITGADGEGIKAYSRSGSVTVLR